MVLVGDAYQLAPVKARGGMFEQMCADLPWSQRLGEVWRMRNREERDASLALRSGHGNRLRKAVGWYRTHDRLHTGDPIAMADDALDAYLTKTAPKGKTPLLICDTWEIADALNSRLHDDLIGAHGPTARGHRDHVIGVGDIIMSRNNDSSIDVQPGPGAPRPTASTKSATATAGASPASTPNATASPPCGSPTKPGRCSTATTCASTSPWATHQPCTPRKASPPTAPTPSSVRAPPAPWPTWR